MPLRFQYTRQVWLPDLGLYYYKARIYSSRLGRFLQTDPVGYKDQVNLYAYVGNDPVNGRDPTGYSTVCSNGSCRITADTYNSALSSHETITASAEVKAAAEAGIGIVRVGSGLTEKAAWVVRGANGQASVERAHHVRTSSDADSETAKVRPPAGALALMHGHIDSGEYRSNGMVDAPEANGGYGDTASLKDGLANGTESHGQIGWHEMDDGQLTFTYPESAMNKTQNQDMQRNLNSEQKLFQQPPPKKPEPLN